MKSENDDLYPRPSLKVHVVEPHASVRRGWTGCRIGENVEFYTDRLESYCIATWEPVIYDALLVAAAAEFADRTQKRPAMSWQRFFVFSSRFMSPNAGTTGLYPKPCRMRFRFPDRGWMADRILPRAARRWRSQSNNISIFLQY